MPISPLSNVQNPSQFSGVGKYDHLITNDGRLHRSLYIDESIFSEEMVKVFGRSWVFLLHEAEIPNNFDFKTITVGRRPTIVTRGGDGKIRALLNRCTHRGSPVCVAEKGNTKRFLCPYHAWTFDTAGTLVSVPFPDGYGQEFDKQAHNLRVFPRVQSYRGYVFGSLNADVEPVEEWLGNARAIIDWSVDTDSIGSNGLRVVKGAQMTYRGNWKHQNDNNTDGYHAPFLHSSTNAMNLRRHGEGKWLSHINDKTDMVVQYLGNGHKLGDHRPAITSAWDQARPMPGRETHALAIREQHTADEAKRYLDMTARAGINLIVFPNLFILGNGSFAVYEPVAVDLTYVRYYTTLLNDAPDEVNNLRVRFEEDFNNVGARDDLAQLEEVQKSLTLIPEMEWVDVTRGMAREYFDDRGILTSNKTDDTAIRGSYQHWLKLMNAPVQLQHSSSS